MKTCTCGNKIAFDQCCGPLLKGQKIAPTAEALMRSRYSAFCEKNLDYLEKSHDPETRRDFDRRAQQEWADKARFTRLEVLSTSENGDQGFVEFRAHYFYEGRACVHHEHSRFRRLFGSWYFRDGRVE